MCKIQRRLLIIVLTVMLALAFSHAAPERASQSSDRASISTKATEIDPILFSLMIILLVAKLGGDLTERVKQPAVLG